MKRSIVATWSAFDTDVCIALRLKRGDNRLFYFAAEPTTPPGRRAVVSRCFDLSLDPVRELVTLAEDENVASLELQLLFGDMEQFCRVLEELLTFKLELKKFS